MQRLVSLFISTFILSTSLWGASLVLAQEQQPDSGKESVLQQDEQSETDAYLTTRPTNTFFAGDLIGKSVMTKGDKEDQEIGPISELVIDEFGQIVALTVGAGSGGFMGMGVKVVAIPWETIELTRKEGEDRYTIYTNVDIDTLKNAPEFNKK